MGSQPAPPPSLLLLLLLSAPCAHRASQPRTSSMNRGEQVLHAYRVVDARRGGGKGSGVGEVSRQPAARPSLSSALLSLLFLVDPSTSPLHALKSPRNMHGCIARPLQHVLRGD